MLSLFSLIRSRIDHDGEAVSRIGGCCRRPAVVSVLVVSSREPLRQAATGGAPGRFCRGNPFRRRPMLANLLARVGNLPSSFASLTLVRCLRSRPSRGGSGPSSLIRNSRRVSRSSSQSAAGPGAMSFGKSIVPSLPSIVSGATFYGHSDRRIQHRLNAYPMSTAA